MARQDALISADAHVNEPPDLWTARLPSRWAGRAPRMERFEQGDAWVMEGALDPINFGANCNVGLPPEQRPAWIPWEAVRAGGHVPSARVEEQIADGIGAEVLYPTPRVSNQLWWNAEDPDFHVACIGAYNDWLSEFCAHDPSRLWGVAMLPNAGVDGALDELHRALALPGMRGALIGQYPHGGEVLDRVDDPLWAALQEAGVPLSIHVGFATGPQGDKSRMKPSQASGAARFFDAPVRVTQFIEGGVFDRFPELHLVLVEVDSSWLPYLAEQLDDRFGRANPATRADIGRQPSEYFSDNILSTFITDRYGIANRHAVGVTQMMWSTDYPHSGSDWPNSRRSIDEQFAGVPDDERALMLGGNAERLYGAR